MRFLGIDYGRKRVGISLSDEGGIIATPSLVLTNSKSLIIEVAEIAREAKVGGIVFGDSRDSSGGENPIMKEIKEFAGKLEKKSTAPIFFERESFTSVEARKNPSGKREVDDSAAALILQRYLDRINKARKKIENSLDDDL